MLSTNDAWHVVIHETTISSIENRQFDILRHAGECKEGYIRSHVNRYSTYSMTASLIVNPMVFIA